MFGIVALDCFIPIRAATFEQNGPFFDQKFDQLLSSSHPVPSSLLRRLRLAANRLELYSVRVQTALATGDRDQLAQALANAAEVNEISKRLSDSLYNFLSSTSDR